MGVDKAGLSLDSLIGARRVTQFIWLNMNPNDYTILNGVTPELTTGGGHIVTGYRIAVEDVGR